MKRTLFFMALLFTVLLCRTPTQAAMTYGLSHYKTNRAYIGSGNYNDPLYNFINEVETTLDGTSGITALILTPGTQPSANTEGTLYYDSASNGLILRNNSAWVTIDTAGGTSLDASYNLGATIDVDGDAVTLTTSNTDNNRVLDLVQNDTTNNPETIRITNTGSGDTLAFVSTGGKDIDGTASSWSVTHAGAGSFASAILGATGLVLQNSETITNATNNGITFDSDTGTVEDFTIGLGANTNIITFSSASGATTVDWGTMTTASGMNLITGDAADLTISITADAGGEDLLIQQAGAVDGSLDLRSAGTGADAIKIYASAAGIDLDGTGSTIVMTNTADGAADDFTIEVAGAQDSSLILQSAGTGGDALSLITSAATGDLKIASADTLDVDSVDHMTFDLSAAGSDFDVDSALGSVYLDGGEAAANAVVIDASNAAGGIDVDAGTGGITVDITGAADFRLDSSAGSVYIEGAEAAADAIVLSASAGGMDLTTAATFDIDLTSTGGRIIATASENTQNTIHLEANGGVTESINLYANQGTGASATTEHDASIQLQSDDGGIGIYTTGNVANAFRLETNGGANEIIMLHANQGTLAADGASSIQLLSDSGGIGIKATGETDQDAIVLNAAAGGVDIIAATAKDITLTGGQITALSNESVASAISLTTNTGAAETILITNTQGTDEAALNFDATAGGIDFDFATGKNMTITGGQFTVLSNENVASAVSLTTNTGASETIVVTNTQGTDPAAINLTASAGSITMTTGLASSGVLVNTSTFEHKVKYIPLSQGVVAATEVIVGGGTGLVCTSLDAGVNEAGSTEGYVSLGDDEDILIFSIPLPDDFVDTGTQADLIIEFDVSEQAAEECNMDVRVFEYDASANITAIITDTIVAANDATRAWKGLVTNSAGIGNEADLAGGDHLIIEITSTADTDDFFLYGIRLTYRVGLQATN